MPDPISGKKYMTTTQAKYYAKETWDTDTEVKSIHPKFHKDFNWHATEPAPATNAWMQKYWGADPMAVQIHNNDRDEDSDSDSESSGSDSDSEDEAQEKKEENKPEEKKPENK